MSRLRERLARLGEPADRRFPMFEAADVAGRLGLVYRAGWAPSVVAEVIAGGRAE